MANNLRAKVTFEPFELEILKKAPIAEAVLDIFVDGLGEVSMSDLERFGEKYSRKYPNKKHREHFTFELKPGTPPEGKAKTTHRQLGWLFSSKDETSIFQVRRE